MKRCLVCMSLAHEREPTCVKCGEASWFARSEERAAGAMETVTASEMVASEATDPASESLAAKPPRRRR